MAEGGAKGGRMSIDVGGRRIVLSPEGIARARIEKAKAHEGSPLAREAVQQASARRDD